MSDVYFIRIENGNTDVMETLAEKARTRSKVASENNIVIVPETVEPLDRDEARTYLEEMADALGMVVEDDESG
jgi:hypothetical protein